MTDWPPWLHEVMDIAVPVLFLVFIVLAFHLSVRARTRNPEGESGMISLAAVGRAVAWSNSALVSLWISDLRVAVRNLTTRRKSPQPPQQRTAH